MTEAEILDAFERAALSSVGQIMPLSVDDGAGNQKYIKPIQAIQAAIVDGADLYKLQARMSDGTIKTVVTKGALVRASVIGSAAAAIAKLRACG